MIIVDYLQQLQGQRALRAGSKELPLFQDLESISRGLDVPIVALSQLSRAVEQQGFKSQLSDLRESGAIEQDADVVLFYLGLGLIEMRRMRVRQRLLLKQRNGLQNSRSDLY